MYSHTRSLNTLEYAFLINELKKIAGKYFTKAYQVDENKFRFKFGDIEITCEPGVRLNIAKYIEEKEVEQSGFVTRLREVLENKRVKDVYQQNKDRIIVIEFENGSKLIFEMFADGNIILVKEDKTVAALRQEQWSDRVIKQNEEYKFPKSNIKESVEDALSERYTVVSMMQLPLGKEYVKEVLARCSIPEKKVGKELTTHEIDHIKKGIEEIKKRAKPYGFYKDNELVDYGLTEFTQYIDLERKEFASFSELLEEFYFKKRVKKSDKIEKLKFRLNQQVERLGELKKEELELKEKGDYIYEKYQELEEVVSIAKTSELNSLEEKLKKYNAKINKKEKEIEIEI